MHAAAVACEPRWRSDAEAQRRPASAGDRSRRGDRPRGAAVPVACARACRPLPAPSSGRLSVARIRREIGMIQGSCHCGRVGWQFDGLPESATACNCTVCRRYGVLWAYDFEGGGIRVAGETTAYRRGQAIEFHLPDLRLRRLLESTAAGRGRPPSDRGQPAAQRAGPDRPRADRPLRRARELRRPATGRTMHRGLLVLTPVCVPRVARWRCTPWRIRRSCSVEVFE